ncbi:hypothetical protein PAHAL_1G157700 [Panicum hallii]|uniref:Uncharacterized protein n=1 Tax=Panicum hallii TaxID=206008 RepID=A0A2T8KVD9_9POAL|nr:hypothetical protein PAHAL_1G157700 [Panicum hallii]
MHWAPHKRELYRSREALKRGRKAPQPLRRITDTLSLASDATASPLHRLSTTTPCPRPIPSRAGKTGVGNTHGFLVAFVVSLFSLVFFLSFLFSAEVVHKTLLLFYFNKSQ